MAVIIDSVSPNPIVIPRNGSVNVTVTAHPDATDVTGTVEIRLTPAGGGTPIVLAAGTTPVTVNAPDDPLPWDRINLVPVSLPGVTVTRVSNGVYRLTHAG